MTKRWALQDAKARLSELVRASAKEPQHITLRGEPAAVVLSADDYRLLCEKGITGAKRRTFYEIWKAAPRVPEFKVPPRRREKPRKLDL
jgi:prevent-host-death family protein